MERFLVEFLRRNSDVAIGLTAAQLESLTLFVIGVIWIAIVRAPPRLAPAARRRAAPPRASGREVGAAPVNQTLSPWAPTTRSSTSSTSAAGISGLKRRADVHRDGDWHLAFHLWVVAPAGVLLQRRARDKASWPGFLDASAAGHLLAGESIRDGLREADEELGVAYVFDDLAHLGVHRVADTERSGTVNRELQHVFAVRDDRPLAAWRDFDRVELDGLVLDWPRGFASLAAAVNDGRAGSDVVRARSWDGSS